MKPIRTTSIILALALGACSERDPVAPPPQGGLNPCGDGGTPVVVSLPLGGVAVLSDRAAIGCAELAAEGGGSGTFLVVAANADTAPDKSPTFVLADSSVNIVLADVAAQRSGVLSERGTAAELSSALTQPEAGASVSAEAHLRAMERRVLRLSDRQSLREAASVRRATSVLGQVGTQATPAVGDTIPYKVPDATSDDACADFTQIRAVVKAVGQHGILVQDVDAPTGGFTSADFTAIADEFDQVIYTADTVHFGNPLDIDGNSRVVLLYTPVVNSVTERGSKSVTEGFFFGGDLFPVSQCEQSNEAEVFYLIVPDPLAKFSDARTAASVRQNTRGTIAHEFQHMINLSVRIRNNAPEDEATWLNEGLSHFAEELVGRKVRGFNDTQELTITEVADTSNGLKDFNAFFGQNLVRFRNWLRAPSDLGATSAHADTSLAVRGAAWALLRWSADHYANGDVPAFTRALVAGPQSGVRNLTARTGVPFDSLMAGWMVANFADDLAITGIANRYSYTSWDIRNVEAAVNEGTFPLVAAPLASNQSLDGTAPSAGGSYFQSATSSGSRTIIGQLNSSGGTVTYTGARLYILRIQ